MKKYIFIVAAALLFVIPFGVFAEIHLNGLLSVDYYDNEKDANLDASSAQSNQGDARTFDVTALALMASADITDRIQVKTDLLFDGYGKLINTAQNNQMSVLQAYVGIEEVFDWPVNIKLGKFIAPFGVEPFPIGTFRHRPITSSLVKQYTSLGSITGAEVSGGWKWLDLSVFAVNGVSPRVNSWTGEDGLVTGASTGTGGDVNLNDDDNNLAIGGRLGITPDFFEGFSGGVSFVLSDADPDRQYIMHHNNNPNFPLAPPTVGGALTPLLNVGEQISIWDADAVYTRGPLEFRSEFVAGRIRNQLGMHLKFRGAVGQFAYDVSSRITGLIRYGWYDQDRHQTPKEDRQSWTYSVNYMIHPQALLKLEYRENGEGEGLNNSHTLIGVGTENGLGTLNSSAATRNGGGEDHNDQVGASLIILF